MNVKILRLKNGDDIICDLEKDGDTYYINAPMTIWMDGPTNVPKLCMDHWLPLPVIKDNFVTLKSEDIMTEFYPNEQLEEYYTHTIDQLNSVLRTKEMADQMNNDDLLETILAMEEGSGSTFH